MSVLGLIVVYQAFAYMAISTANEGGPNDAVVLGWPLGEMIVAGIGIGLAAVALGLACSSLVNSVAAAIALLPILLIVQLLIMQGGVFSNNKPVLYQASFASSAGWGFADMASTVGLNNQQAVWSVAKQLQTIDTQNPQALFAVLSHPSRGNPRWNHQAGAWVRGFAALLVLIAVGVTVAIVVLRRFDPI